MRDGTFAFEGGVTSVVEDLTGTPAESFEATARRYAALPFARPTIGNRLKTFIHFNLAPFYPGTDLAKWDNRMAFPRAPHPSLSVADARWREEHAAQMAIHGGSPLTTLARIRAA